MRISAQNQIFATPNTFGGATGMAAVTQSNAPVSPTATANDTIEPPKSILQKPTGGLASLYETSKRAGPIADTDRTSGKRTSFAADSHAVPNKPTLKQRLKQKVNKIRESYEEYRRSLNDAGRRVSLPEYYKGRELFKHC